MIGVRPNGGGKEKAEQNEGLMVVVDLEASLKLSVVSSRPLIGLPVGLIANIR